VLLFATACPSRDLDRARELEAEGHLREAGEAYVDIAKKDPANLAAWDAAIELWCKKSTNVGECMSVLDLELDRLGNLDRHKSALSEVLELRARARLEQGLTEAALADLDRAERAMPNRSTVFTARARALLKQSDKDAVVEALKRAKELDAANPEIEDILREMNAPKPIRAPSGEGFGGSP
jgi:tetratricopeptide (TPR) repeat protein